MSIVHELIAKELFGTFVRLKHSETGEEVLIPKIFWYSAKDGKNGSAVIEVNAVLPGLVHLYEASRTLHEISTKRIIDFADDRKWIEQEEK